MANTGKFRYDIEMNVDKGSVDRSKSQFNDLLKSLKQIQNQAKNMDLIGKADDNIKNAADEAKKLENALKAAYNPNLGQTNLIKFEEEIKKAWGSVEKMRISFAKVGQEGIFNHLANEIMGTNNQLRTTNKLLDKMAVTLGNTIRYGISSSIFNNLTNSISQAYNYTKNLDKSLNDIRIVSNASAKEMEKFAKYANESAKNLGASTLDYTKGALIYYQQGLTDEEVKQRTDITLKMSNVLGESASAVSDYMTAIWNNFDDGSKSLEHYADVITALGAATASSSEEIAEGLEKFASVADTVGLSYEYATSALATVVAETRQSADVVGTAFKTLFARIQDLELGKTLDDGTTLGKYSEALEKVGINIKNQSGELKDMNTILNEMGSKWQTLNKDQQVALAQSVAGTRQYTQLVALMDNWGTFQKNLKVAQNSAGTLEEQQEIYMQSVEAHLQKLSTEWERTWDTLFDTDAIKAFADIATGVLKQVNDVLKGMGGGLNTIWVLASQIVVLFSKQLGNEVTRISKNIQLWKEERNTDKFKQSFMNNKADEIRTELYKQGYDVSNEDIKQQGEYLAKAVEYRKVLNQEELKAFNQASKDITLNKTKLNYLKQIRKDESVSEIGAQADLKETREQIEETKKSYTSLLTSLKELKNKQGAEGQEKITATDIWNQIDQSKEWEAIHPQTFAMIEESLSVYKDGIDDIDEAIKAVGDASDQTLATLQEKEKKQAEIVFAKSDQGQQTITNLENEINEEDKLIKKLDEEAAARLRNQKIMRAVGGISEIVASVSGAFSVLSDETSNATDKANAAFQGLIGTAKGIADATGHPIIGMAIQIGGPLVKSILEATGAWDWFTDKFKSDAERAQEKIDQLRQSAQKLSEEASELQGIVDGLRSSFESYTSVIEILNKCHIGTTEWNEALQNVNKTVLDILEQYPELAKIPGIIESTNDGLRINDKIYKAYIQQIQNQQIVTQAASLRMQQEVQKNVDNLTKSNLQKDMAKITNDEINKYGTNSREKYSARNAQNYEVNPYYVQELNRKITDSQFERLRNAAQPGQDYYSEVVKIAEELKQSHQLTEDSAKIWVKSMDSYRDSLNEYSKSIEDNAIAIKNANKAVANAVLGTDASEAQKRMFAQMYDRRVSSSSQEYSQWIKDTVKRDDTGYDEFLKKLNKVTGNQYERAQTQTNTIRGNDGDEGIYVYDKNLQKDVFYTRDEWANIMGSKGSIEQTLNSSQFQNFNKKLQSAAYWANGKSYGEENVKTDILEKIAGEGFDVNELTEEEAQQLAQNADKYQKALQVLGAETGVSFLEGFDQIIADASNWDAEKHAEIIAQQFKADLHAAAAASGEEFDLDAEAFEGYGKYIAEIADQSDELADSLKTDGKAAGIVTQSIMRMNRGIETLADGMEDWNDVLKTSTKESYEYWEALDKIKGGLADVLDVEKDAISNNFIEDHLDEITQAAEGSETAIDNLRDAYADQVILDIAANINFDDEDITTTKEKMIQAINDIQADIPSLDIGALDPIDDAEFIASCQKLIDDSNMTVEEANKMFAALGFEAEYKEDAAETISTVPVYTTYEKIEETPKDNEGNEVPGYRAKKSTFTTQTGTVELPGTMSIGSIATSTNDGKNVRKPQITKLTKKATGSYNNYSSKNAGGGSPGKSSGGSSKEPKKVDRLNDQADRYHKVNTQISKVENSLKKVQSQQDKFVGSKLINNLNQQWNLLNQQIANYNEKLKIANKEQDELRQKLAQQGVQFNADGTIANYMEAFQAQEDYANGLIEQYNRLSAEEQEVWDNDKRLDNAKEQFNDFKENLDRYDELVSDFIPQLQQSIQDGIDKQIELNIKKFNMELEITLNMDQATRDWNAWAKKALEGIDASDILGNVRARLKDFYTYFNQAGTADIQVETKHLNDLLEELRSMDRGEDNVYGNARAKGLEELKTYYTQLMQSISDVIDLQEELHQAVLNEMDEVQENFQKQVESYQFLTEIINHDMKIISLTLGEDAYGEMAKFYQMQQENYEKQLDFQRQQKDFWYEQMQAAEEGSEEWESARDKWKDAVKEFDALLETTLENARAKFENTIKDIFKNLNNSITNGMGLDYVKTEWDLINKNADRYLDTINRTYEIREFEKKVTDSINKADNVGVQQRLKKLMDEQVTSLKEKEKVTQYDIDRANKLYEIELARIALEEAQRNKSQMRLRRDSQGNYSYQYVADNDAVNDAQNQLDDLYNSLYNFDKDRYNQVLNDVYDIWNEYQQAMADAALINDPQQRAEKELLIQQKYDELMTQAANDYETSKFNLEQSFFMDWAHLNGQRYDSTKDLTDKEKELMLTEMIPTWENGISAMADQFTGKDGFKEKTTGAWNQIKEAENTYAEDVKTLETISGQTFGAIANGEDEAITKAQTLVEENNKVITANKEQLKAVTDVYNKVVALTKEYEKEYAAAKKAAEEAYNYHQKELALQQAAAKAQEKTTSSAETSTPTTSSSATSASEQNQKSGVTSGGDGTPQVGEYVTYNGGAYYETSYGEGNAGYRGPGKKVKITAIYSGRPYPIHVMSSDSAYGWLKQNQISGYDTGGYTGQWDNNGKLAFLHQKELVLNAQDTENMLNTVAIMRSLAFSLGSSMLARMAGATAQGYMYGESGSGALEQNVHIDAQFPNVHNAAEIEEALNNLVNAASQRIMEK